MKAAFRLTAFVLLWNLVQFVFVFLFLCLQIHELDEDKKRQYIKRYFRKCLRIKGVQNAIVFNSLGIPKQSTFDRDETIRSVGLFDDLLLKVKLAIQVIDTNDQFISVRVRTHKFEIFITKDLNDIYFVIFQNANGNKKKYKFILILLRLTGFY